MSPGSRSRPPPRSAGHPVQAGYLSPPGHLAGRDAQFCAKRGARRSPKLGSVVDAAQRERVAVGGERGQRQEVRRDGLPHQILEAGRKFERVRGGVLPLPPGPVPGGASLSHLVDVMEFGQR